MTRTALEHTQGFTTDAARALHDQAMRQEERANETDQQKHPGRRAMLLMIASNTYTGAGRFYEAAAEWMDAPNMETDSNREAARRYRHDARRCYSRAERLKETALASKAERMNA